MSNFKKPASSSFPVRSLESIGGQDAPIPNELILSTFVNGSSKIILDYGRAEGGISFFETSQVESDGIPVNIEVVYSETSLGVEKATGDGPFFLFSNAMDTYRVNTHTFDPSVNRQYVESRFAQKSQRYQKITLKTPNSSIRFSSIGFRKIKARTPVKSSFKCSNEKLERIWNTGVRTVEMCTVDVAETEEAWEVTEQGIRILGQHWAPCRQGTRWGDYSATFEVMIESGGASWGVHMVANGLIFCLDAQKRSLASFEGLSDSGGIFPTKALGLWDLPPNILLDDWLLVETTCRGATVDVNINGQALAILKDLDIHPILGGSTNNTGSIAFGGPAHYAATYRSLIVKDLNAHTLYENDFLRANKSRTMKDFAVGTNRLAYTIDGAKRDRACFAGDLFVMGRSIFYSTGFAEAVLGSIELLSSHQTKEGYMGNLCPIQAPVHEAPDEPPTYAFYSLSYALELVVATKEYVMHTGDLAIATKLWGPFQKLLAFVSRFEDSRGLIVAPPPLSMDWFPMAGPIFGASGKINLAFYDALRSMSLICSFIDTEDIYAGRADCLKHNIAEYLWDKKAGILCMSDLVLAPGICQDIHAYGITIGVTQPLLTSLRALTAPKTGELPLAFRNIDKWDRIKVVSPYASGFAAEALFTRGEGVAAVELIERVWGVMVDTSNPNYSGGHWEAMTQDGMPITTDCSLVHGWSTWPVFLLPQYLAGLKPLEPGWRRFKVRPVLANLTTVDVKLSTPAGEVEVSLLVDEAKGAAAITITAPLGSVAEIYAPEDWALANSKSRHEAEYLEKLVLKGQGEQVKLGMCKTAQLNHKDDESSVKSPSRVAEAIETLLLKSDSGAAQCQRESESTLTQFWRRTLKLFCK